MISNIIDHRKHPYRWKRVNAIVEAAEHDNSVPDADQAPEAPALDVVDYAELRDVSVQQAIAWANSQRCPVTLFLYDRNDGIGEVHFFARGARWSGPAENISPEADERGP